jgi:hypothetical protein
MSEEIIDAIVLADDDRDENPGHKIINAIVKQVENTAGSRFHKSKNDQARRDAEYLAFSLGADDEKELTLKEYIDLEVKKMEFEHNLTTVNKGYFYVRDEKNIEIKNFEEGLDKIFG